MLRRIVWILVALAIVLGTGTTYATPVQEELGTRASIAPYMVTDSADGGTFWAYGSIRRSALGYPSHFCVGARGQYMDWDSQPQRRVDVYEESCQTPQRIAVDPMAWEASVAGSLPTVVRRDTWEWDDQQISWVHLGEETSSGVATFDLRWVGTTGQTSPIVTGVPVCVTYSLLTPVVPCPSTHVGTGLRRSAQWEGYIKLEGAGLSFSNETPGNSEHYPTTLGIWLGT